MIIGWRSNTNVNVKQIFLPVVAIHSDILQILFFHPYHPSTCSTKLVEPDTDISSKGRTLKSFHTGVHFKSA